MEHRLLLDEAVKDRVTIDETLILRRSTKFHVKVWSRALKHHSLVWVAPTGLLLLFTLIKELLTTFNIWIEPLNFWVYLTEVQFSSLELRCQRIHNHISITFIVLVRAALTNIVMVNHKPFVVFLVLQCLLNFMEVPFILHWRWRLTRTLVLLRARELSSCLSLGIVREFSYLVSWIFALCKWADLLKMWVPILN